MPAHDHTFYFPDDLTYFPRATKGFITHAHDLGWSLRWLGTAHNLACATAPGREKSINIPRTNVNDNRMRSWVKILQRYTDPEKFAEYADSVLRPGKLPPPIGTDPVMELHPPKTPIPRPTTAVAEAMRAAHEAAEKQASQVVTALDHHDRTIVTEKPWLVRKDGVEGGRGRMYESHAVVHRVWSDGSEDYKCRFCPRTKSNPRSIATHASKMSPDTHPRRPGPPQMREVPVYTPTTIKHGGSTVRRLTSEVLHALDAIEDWQSLSREELAHRVAEVMHEKRPDRLPAEPLTPEQIIGRIVLMVDQGRLAEMHQKVEQMAASLVEATEARQRLATEVVEAQHEARRLREERKALRDLLTEDRSE